MVFVEFSLHFIRKIAIGIAYTWAIDSKVEFDSLFFLVYFDMISLESAQ